MKLGVSCAVRSASETVELARIADRAGFWGVGVPDTAPHIQQGCYPTITAALLATEQIHVGPHVTNPVNHHWSVHGSAARALEDLAPGRFFLGIGTGDGAVHAVGLRPATWADVESAVRELRMISPPGLRVVVAASGPKGATFAGRFATDLELGVGLDVGTLQRFAARARASREAAGVAEPLRIWAMVPALVIEREDDVEETRRALRPHVNGAARFCFSSTFEDKGVSAEWEDAMRERFARYDHQFHGVMGPDAPNAVLFEDRPDIQAYLTDRMAVIDTAERVREKLVATAQDAELEGIFLSVMAAPGETRLPALERLGAALESELG